ncbi:MAG: hypothetical protein M1839_007870 [Geoglossum umbratile]|nr:MAG: hypothetical protein M1839_007870 [Geoglossum umbratile]
MNQLAFQILFFLRVVQLVGATVTVHNTCNLIYFHAILHQDIPRGEIIVFFASVITALESYISSACALSKREARPNYSRLLRTAGITTIVSAYGYRAVRNVPYIRVFCEGDDFASLYDNVENHFCTLVCNLIVFGAIMVVFTALIAVFAAVGLTLERRDGRVKLEDAASDDGNCAVLAPDEKMCLLASQRAVLEGE